MFLTGHKKDELARVSKDIINLFAERGLTVFEAKYVLEITEHSIETTADVKKLNW